MHAKRPFAVFDIDGTIIRWQLYHALADELVRRDHLNAQDFDAVRQARMAWKTRTHEASFNDYEMTLVKLIDSKLPTIKVADLQSAARAVIATYKDQVYTYTRELIKDLKRQKYLLFAISASQAEIVQLLAEYYQFDDYRGSVYEVKKGYFTGQKDLLLSERKPFHLKQLVKQHQATWQGSLAVGDTESDIAMLSTVEQPIAFNPTKTLFEHAARQNWPIVVERKNMVYKLEPGHDGYLLAQANR